ncbi:MBL fold metallo-hydrolase [bacterium]|nr:MBL fold metallo-hydrolase [bacterium]
MREVAPGVWQLSGFPPNAINLFLVGDILIDAATRLAERRVFPQLEGRKITALALTHAHPDHQGLAKCIRERMGVPVCCPEKDVPIMEGRERMQPDTAMTRFSTRIWAGPPCPVDRVLREGDEIAGFQVVDAPGHTPGHVIYFRRQDRVAIVGDVLNGMNLLTTWPGLHEPPPFFTWDIASNRRSIRKLAALEPEVLLFGHGPPCRDPRKLQKLVERLPH